MLHLLGLHYNSLQCINFRFLFFILRQINSRYGNKNSMNDNKNTQSTVIVTVSMNAPKKVFPKNTDLIEKRMKLPYQ